MNANANKEILTIGSSTYVLGLLGALGVFAIWTAVLVAWPAFSYIAAKLF